MSSRGSRLVGEVALPETLFEKAPQLSNERDSQDSFSVAIATRKQAKTLTFK